MSQISSGLGYSGMGGASIKEAEKPEEVEEEVSRLLGFIPETSYLREQNKIYLID